MTQDQISNLLLDLIDVRDALPARVLKMPKDNEGTDFTIGDLLDDAIAFLSEHSTGETA